MKPYRFRLIYGLWTGILLLAGCAAPVPALTPTPVAPLTVSLLYPGPENVVEMGRALKCIVQIADANGAPVTDAQVSLALSDPGGNQAAVLPAHAGPGEVYRTEAWLIPHRSRPGAWNLVVQVVSGAESREAHGSFQVENSTSEDLLDNYGFWLDAPRLKGIEPTIAAERGDAANGLVRWGGVIPALHIFTENWVEIHWRQGNFRLDSSEAVRRFLLEELGDLGFTPLRALGDFSPAQFKGWQAWRGKARGELSRYDMEWVVFYAPEVDKTYALATTVVQPPVDIDPHAALRDSFALFTDRPAQGVAPVPLLALSPAPRLVSPPLGARFEGLAHPVVLEWAPVKELAGDEYYEIVVDYNHRETNYKLRYATRENQLALPVELYETPNCQVFNWRVTLKQQTGLNSTGQPTGKALTYPSLYGYVIWAYPPGLEPPFDLICPNEQY